MIVWLLLLSVALINKFAEGETNLSAVSPPSGDATNDKPDTLVKAKFNFTTNGSFSGEFGKFANGVGEVAPSPLETSKPNQQALVDPNREMLKELIANLLNSNSRIGSRFAKRFSDDRMAVGFKPDLEQKNIPFKAPSVFEHTDKCVFKNAKCWCREEPVTVACTWETDCFCVTTVTCGPTKPCPEHRDKWCFVKTPNMYEGRTPLACILKTTIPICSTPGYTPCGTFTPPCVHPTPHTIEPCVCPTNGPCTCPCPPAKFYDPDLFSFLFKRAALLPDPLRNSTMDLLNRHLRKRSARRFQLPLSKHRN